MKVIRYCPNCWKEVPPGAGACPHCGAATDDSALPFADRLLRTLRHPEPTRAGLAIEILAERLHDRRAVAPLADLLTASADMEIRRQAARGLGALADAAALPALQRVLEDGEVPYVVRSEAARALGRIGGEAAEAALRRAVHDPRASVAQAASLALEALNAEASR